VSEDNLLECIGSLTDKGYLVIPNFLNRSDCMVFARRLQLLIDEDLNSPKLPTQDRYMVHNPMLRDSSFMRFLKKSTLTEIVGSVLHDTFLLYAFTTSTMPPNGSNWSRRVHVDCPRLIPGYPTNMNAFIPLTDVSVDNGGIEIMPGSHGRATKPSLREFDSSKLVPELDAGSLLIFYSRLWHSGGENKTMQPRHALTFNFCRSFMRQRFDYPRMMTAAQIEGLDEMQRQLLGFNVRVPASMDEYYLPEAERLYKPNQG
jgi:ectoine hydroxylase-related dioxygenase (phytanoyl-CoA dioxygenase family)